jgi:ubiquinone/menaquinone biosynthesis C-methylase UbiE
LIKSTSTNDQVKAQGLSEVRSLFNAKAKAWTKKYEAGGALTFRIGAFTGRVETLLGVGDRILDLGCGTGPIAAACSRIGFRVTACDIAEEMIEVGKRTYPGSTIDWRLLPQEWERLPFDACTFDGIIASSIFEYVADVKGVISECRRILKPGAILIATIPNLRAPSRKLEKIIRPAVTVLKCVPGTDRIPKLQSYGSYLKLSRNRWPLGEWVRIANEAHFEVLDGIGKGALNGSLYLLVFRKMS